VVVVVEEEEEVKKEEEEVFNGGSAIAIFRGWGPSIPKLFLDLYTYTQMV